MRPKRVIKGVSRGADSAPLVGKGPEAVLLAPRRNRDRSRLKRGYAKIVQASMEEASKVLADCQLPFLAQQLHLRHPLDHVADVAVVKGRLGAILHLLRLNPPEPDTFLRVRSKLDLLANLVKLNV
jgi:hypothetical protein